MPYSKWFYTFTCKCQETVLLSIIHLLISNLEVQQYIPCTETTSDLRDTAVKVIPCCIGHTVA